MARAGELTKQVTFERMVAGTDSLGNTTTGSWAQLGDPVKGRLRQETGRERREGGRLQAELAATLRLRASSAARGVTEADRVVIGGVAWSISAIREVPGQRARERWLDFELIRGRAH